MEKEKKGVISDIEIERDNARLEILRDGFNSEFWDLLCKILSSWKSTLAHKIISSFGISESEIRYNQGYYRAIDDFIKLKVILKKKGVSDSDKNKS